eukprot:scaffold5477_cov75-Skeletonema_dohrnii-CCMP3373.AAC.5
MYVAKRYFFFAVCSEFGAEGGETNEKRRCVASKSRVQRTAPTIQDIMADGGRDVFVYRGGRAPLDVTRARIDKSVEEIEDGAFGDCKHLVQVETHDGIRKVGRSAFIRCGSLTSIDLRSAIEIGLYAFYGCENLTDVEFGDKLETIGTCAFYECTSLELLNLTSIITVRAGAFHSCKALTSIEFSERLDTIEQNAFRYCKRLRRIAIPLKRDLFTFDRQWQEYNQFDNCDLLTTVDHVGGAHNKTISSLHMESWRIEMIAEINRINKDLPNTPVHEKTANTPVHEKTAAIKQWVDSVIDKIDHYKAEHHRYVKEAVTLLELALWKAKLAEIEENAAERKTKTVNIIDAESVRKEKRITCGAGTVIKNVLPFLQLE